jgi:YD repeat-containing protein
VLTGQVVKTTDAKGQATYVLYDRFERQSASYDATKHRTSASQYDAVNRVIAATDTFPVRLLVIPTLMRRGRRFLLMRWV